jgi:hypothetical protein
LQGVVDEFQTSSIRSRCYLQRESSPRRSHLHRRLEADRPSR